MEIEPESFEIWITDISRSGPGVGRDDQGRVVFVPGTAPGDRARVRVLHRKKRFIEAEVIELLERSCERVQPKCSVYGRCGGCQWQHLPYERQWKTKVSGALHALARIGFSEAHTLKRSEFPAADPWGYRNRIQLRGGKFGLGFYARASHEVVAVDRCEIAREELNRALSGYRSEAIRRGSPSKLELQVSESGEVLASWNSRHAALGFRQVHDAQNDELRRWVSEQLSDGPGLLDLYGGSGNLSLGLVNRFQVIHCVDRGAGSNMWASEERELAGRFYFHSADVGRWVNATSSSGLGFQGGGCILDPPREGCGEALSSIDQLLGELQISELIAVGCDPDSWARDVSRFCARGWRVESLAFFDFFPQTVHFESVAKLVRV